MPPPQLPEARSLRQHAIEVSQSSAQFFFGSAGRVALADFANASSLGGRHAELAGRSVLLATPDQLAAALALIELDGIARRIVLCPPDISAAHLSHIMAEAEIDAVVSDRSTDGTSTASVTENHTGPLRVAVAGSLSHVNDVPLGGRRTEWVLVTSGTTGPPKLVRHDVASLTAPIEPGGPPPVWGTFYDIRRYGGLQIFFRTVIGGGSLVLSNAGETIADHLGRLAAAGATHLSGTPSHWRRVLMSPQARSIAPRQVRLSGEIADQPILDKLRACYPLAAVGHAYASTEAGVGFEVNDGLAGFPTTLVGGGNGGVEIRIEDGSLRLRSARTAACYVGRDTAPLRDAEGFVDTGDMVARSGDRYHFVGRKGGIINVGGRKVHPEEVEAAINRHPDVAASLVRSRRNPITGAIVVADVVLCDRPANARVSAETEREIERELLAICRRELADYKVPATLRFVPSLELTVAGKLVRHA
jgi:acyl-coenzyme A synthetase/AMP-(fatty) acid ligase